MDYLEENGLDNTQPKAPSPLGGGSGGNGTADINSMAPEGIAPQPDHHRNKRGDGDPQEDHQGPEKRGGEHIAHGSGPRQNEIGELANPEAQPVSAFLRGWQDLYLYRRERRVENRVQGVEVGPLGQGNVHEGPAFLGSDSRLRHVLPLMSDKSDVANGTAPMPENGSAGQNELPEAVSHADERAK